MATTNLTTQSLGDMLVQSGNGTPNHVAPRGSMYTNMDTGNLYLNKDGATSWSEMILSAFGEMYRTATSTVSPSTAGWTELTLNMASRNAFGVTVTGGRLVIDAAYAGTYGIFMTTTVQYIATATTYTLGVSKNSTVPAAGQSQSTSVTASRITGNASVLTTISLIAGDTVSFVIQAGTAGNIDVKFSNLLIWRKGD